MSRGREPGTVFERWEGGAWEWERERKERETERGSRRTLCGWTENRRVGSKGQWGPAVKAFDCHVRDHGLDQRLQLQSLWATWVLEVWFVENMEKLGSGSSTLCCSHHRLSRAHGVHFFPTCIQLASNWNWPWWRYLYHRNWQMLPSRGLSPAPRDPVLKHLPAPLPSPKRKPHPSLLVSLVLMILQIRKWSRLGHFIFVCT